MKTLYVDRAGGQWELFDYVKGRKRRLGSDYAYDRVEIYAQVNGYDKIVRLEGTEPAYEDYLADKMLFGLAGGL